MSDFNSSTCLSTVPLIQGAMSDEMDYSWLAVLLTCLTMLYIFKLVGLIHQCKISADK